MRTGFYLERNKNGEEDPDLAQVLPSGLGRETVEKIACCSSAEGDNGGQNQGAGSRRRSRGRGQGERGQGELCHLHTLPLGSLQHSLQLP